MDFLRGLKQGQNDTCLPAEYRRLASGTFHTCQAPPSCECTSWGHLLGPFSCIGAVPASQEAVWLRQAVAKEIASLSKEKEVLEGKVLKKDCPGGWVVTRGCFGEVPCWGKCVRVWGDEMNPVHGRVKLVL